jgi:predicted DCC family thiol-disulfide oxidoreductase YuxK
MSDKIKQIIFFDGVCNLCNASVQVVLKNDNKAIYHFASLQSDFAAEFFETHGYTPVTQSIILYNGKSFYTKSAAVLRVAGNLKFPFPLLLIFHIVPDFLRDPVYSFIAKNRYRLFGKQESCMIPQPQWKVRFLD